MKKLTISKELTSIVKNFSVSAYTFSLVEKNNKENLSIEITKAFDEITKEYQQKYQIEEVTKIEKIKQTRDGYKLLGKDPSHTRPACEALLRRIIKNGNIYRLGDAIDIGNYISIKLMKSVCMVDLDKIVGDINIRIGNTNDIYEGINRGVINVSNIPLYTDDVSPFGNPTSDTLRTAITSQTENVLIMLIHFDSNIEENEQMMLTILNKYLKINNLNKIIVTND